jgi:ribonuclease HI
VSRTILGTPSAETAAARRLGDGTGEGRMPDAPPHDLPGVTIYTDGGADPNPGPGGWGAVLLHPETGKAQELRGGEPVTTNNRMELTAAIRALAALLHPCRVELHTDSEYLRRGVTEWLPGWIARGWRRKAGELQNEDLWRQLAAAAARHEVRWRWVKGHAGDPRNARADQLATVAIREQRAAAAATAAGSGGAAARDGSGAAGAAAAAPPEFDVFLRVSRSPRGAGWAALIRRAALSSGSSGPSGSSDPAGAEVPSESVRSGRLPAAAAASANALDLAAAAAVLEALPAGAAVAVHTVSDYLRHGASRWLPGWRQRGWKTKEGSPVLNRALWERLAAAMAARRVSWPEVKGREVEELDRLAPIAKAAAQGQADER